MKNTDSKKDDINQRDNEKFVISDPRELVMLSEDDLQKMIEADLKTKKGHQ